MQLESTLTCPSCGHRFVETMPTNACQFFYDCKGCGTLLRPKPGDCCVFCSFEPGVFPGRIARPRFFLTFGKGHRRRGRGSVAIFVLLTI